MIQKNLDDRSTQRLVRVSRSDDFPLRGLLTCDRTHTKLT